MNMIAAVDQNWAIGKDGDQLVYIPEQMGTGIKGEGSS